MVSHSDLLGLATSLLGNARIIYLFFKDRETLCYFKKSRSESDCFAGCVSCGMICQSAFQEQEQEEEREVLFVTVMQMMWPFIDSFEI